MIGKYETLETYYRRKASLEKKAEEKRLAEAAPIPPAGPVYPLPTAPLAGALGGLGTHPGLVNPAF